MKRLLLIASVALALTSCLSDPIEFNNVPDISLGENGKGYRDKGYGEEGELMRTSVRLYGHCSATQATHIGDRGFFVAKNIEDVQHGAATEYVVSTADDSFQKGLTDLEIDQTYYFCAFVRDGGKVAMSNISSFHTKAEGFALVNGLTLNDSTLQAKVADNGGTEVRHVGFCWGLQDSPDIFGKMTFAELDKSGYFSMKIPALNQNGTYYFRAFADNGVTGNRISYSDAISITNNVPDIPNIPDDNIEIPDANFKAYCVENFDKNRDGEISRSEALDATWIHVPEMSIHTLSGIEYFVNITYLCCSVNQLDSLDVSRNTALTQLWCGENNLSELDVSRNTALTHLGCYSNNLSELDISRNTALEILYYEHNNLSELDVSRNIALTLLSGGDNNLSELDVSRNTALTELWCWSNNLSELDVSMNTALTGLECMDNNLSKLDVSQNTALTHLGCYSNNLSELDISRNTALEVLYCFYNNLSELDISQNSALKGLDCGYNHLEELDISRNTELSWLVCDSNYISKLDVSQNSLLTDLYCGSCQLSELDVSHNPALKGLWCDFNYISVLDVSNNPQLSSLRCFNCPYLTEIWLKTGQTIQEFQYDTDIATIYYK